MAAQRGLYWLLCVTLMSAVATQEKTSCSDWPDIPYNCVCEDDPQYSTHALRCIDSNFTLLPDDLPNLKQMTIQGNNIVILETVPYSAVQSLHLERNGIQFIKDYAFKDLLHLHQLTLSHNSITGIGIKTFAGLGSASTITLTNNRLFEIPDGTFSVLNLENLEILNLEECDLYFIGHKAFDGQNKLQWLYLADNHLSSVDSFINSPDVRNLAVLDLTRNSITSLPTLTEAKNLQEILLTDNKLTEIKTETFAQLKQLKTLFLNKNNIRIIGAGAFSELTHLQHLDLSGNQLVTLEKTVLPPLLELQKLLLYTNPWHCNCSTLWIRTNAVVVDNNGERNMFCHSPDAVEGMSIFSLHDDAFQCTTQHTTVNKVGIAFGCIFMAVVLIVGGVVLYKLKKRKPSLAMSRWPESDINTSYRRVLEPDL